MKRSFFHGVAMGSKAVGSQRASNLVPDLLSGGSAHGTVRGSAAGRHARRHGPSPASQNGT